MTDQRLKIAVFVDFDNIEIGVKTTLGGQFDVGAVLDALKERGEVVSKTAYGDWKRADSHSRLLTQHAIKMVQRNLTPGGDKNGADINLALDALEMAFTHDHINAFVIVGGDSDFISLVEKLKQYDKKVLVVGGRQFTSGILQRNCHEFIAYENIVGQAARRSAGRGRRTPQAALDQAVPIVRRALKVLSDREVSPQLGLLKSTLLQLDSTFSERSYGASTFRDFAQKLATAGVVTLKQSGRDLLVELKSGDADESGDSVAPPGPGLDSTTPEPAPPDPAQLDQGIQEVRRLFAAAPAPPRWPMYVRNVRQYLRSVDKAFDERRHGFGGMLELLRGCQREGLLRLERDRRGILRVYPGGALETPTSVNGAEVSDQKPDAVLGGSEAATEEAADVVPVEPKPPATTEEAAPRPRRRRRASPRVTRDQTPVADAPDAATDTAPPAVSGAPDDEAKPRRRRAASTRRKAPTARKTATPRRSTKRAAATKDE